MSNSARARGDIRTPESHERQRIAKQLVLDVLRRKGFVVRGQKTVHNRHLIDVSDPLGLRRALWFKLGWAPGSHGTSAVQIAMLKKRGAQATPSKLSRTEVLKRVTAKFERARNDGVTDLLLFSLDAANKVPVAALLLSIQEARSAFKECLTLDERRTRNGASPTFWLLGKNEGARKLVECLRDHASEDLLSGGQRGQRGASRILDDAYNDLAPDSFVVGNPAPARDPRQVSRFQRNGRVRKHVLRRAKGMCEHCGALGFETGNGTRYLESHHILALGKDGPDTLENVIALCANDHRHAHFGRDRQAFARQLMNDLAKKLRITRRR